MTQELVEKRKQDAEQIARQFELMAERIRRNGGDNFGGAFMLVPPIGTGKMITLLTLSDQNAGYFWQSVWLAFKAEYEQVERTAQQQRAFG